MKVIVTRNQAITNTSMRGVQYVVASAEVSDYFEDVDGWVIDPGASLSIMGAYNRGAVFTYAPGNWLTVRRDDA